MSNVAFDLFTFGEHNILYKQDKFLYDITAGTTFQTDKKIPVKFLEIIFKNNKQKHYPLIISWNLYILTNYSFNGICYHYISEEEQFSCNSTYFDILFKTHCSMDFSEAVAWECSIKKGVLK